MVNFSIKKREEENIINVYNQTIIKCRQVTLMGMLGEEVLGGEKE